MLNAFLERIKKSEFIDFKETMHVIEQFYDYQPTTFSNGLQQPLINSAGSNEGSCRIFAFAKLHQLTASQTLTLFGQYYQDVLATPAGNDHANIRQFMQDGWAGIVFNGDALQAKAAHVD